MENLLVLLDKIQHVSPLPVFSSETIVVQNAGMQHWLNLSLAKQRGISMNIRYALPAQFLWKLMRSLASDENIPDQSPYSREVLTWRIYSLLGSTIIVEDDSFNQATQYWKSENQTSNHTKGNDEQASLKRYQLAGQLADLYEQYLIFRPEWINGWHQGKTIRESFVNNPQTTDNNDLAALTLWQAKLWQLLIKEQPYNPMSLMQDAIANIAEKKSTLPERISFFGINAMAPMWLDFIHALSKHIDVHFFHLNPCYAYWGDIVSEKQAAKAISRWIEGEPKSEDTNEATITNVEQEFSKDVGNPLLANLGQQGREFMALLQNYSSVNIELFEGIDEDDVKQPQADIQSTTVLEQLQQDILSLTDRRESPINIQDDSITITSCHSALREIQGLHDWLLHQFNQDSSLTPKDILVMCPQIESYAPFVNAVFARGWQSIGDKIPPLPCSIADRSSIDAEPIIAAFTDILDLPDSRFSVSQLIAFLRLPAMQAKFGISLDELAKITLWLEQASIHWGLDQNHKQQILQTEHTNSSFTWQQGLSRLLRGFAYGDNFGQSNTVYQEQLLIASIEGDEAELLGKLMLIIEQLQYSAQQLNKPRTAEKWQSYLLSIINELFDSESDQSFTLIDQAISSLVEYCHHAHFEQAIELLIVRDFLNNHFSQPDPGRQFMVGQVTFCSMLPMRSIPFKVIAVLGLNDGEFPRQRQPLGFDLMQRTPAKLGDRSRRGDDRYLFLEALISARQSLYLSYQGRNIKSNKTKEASLVLKELMDYLVQGFSWKFEGEHSQLRQLAMQAFSDKNYQGKFNSFDHKWLKLKNPLNEQNTSSTYQHSAEKALEDLAINITKTDAFKDNPMSVAAEQVIAFFQHPAKVFAQQHLNLYLDQKTINLTDAEPFNVDRLESYLLRQAMLTQCLLSERSDEAIEQKMSQVLEIATLKGKFPDLPTTAGIFENWKNESVSFSQAIIAQNADNPDMVDVDIKIMLPDRQNSETECRLTAKLPIKAGQLVFYRSSTAKPKDLMTMYLHQLIVQVAIEQNVIAAEYHHISSTRGFFFDTKSQKITEYAFNQIPESEVQLVKLITDYFNGQQKPLLLNGEIADKAFKAHVGAKKAVKAFSQQDFEKLWQDPNAAFALGSDSYMEYFWPLCPEFTSIEHALAEIYLPLYQALIKVKATKPVKAKSAKGVS